MAKQNIPEEADMKEDQKEDKSLVSFPWYILLKTLSILSKHIECLLKCNKLNTTTSA